MLTSAALLRVDDTGRILEQYVNNKTRKWLQTRFELEPNMEYLGIIFDAKFVGNVAEAQEKASKITDIVLYMGSDHADSYDPITYAYNPELLHMKNGPKVDNIYEHGPFYSCFIWSNIRELSFFLSNRISF